MQDLNNRQIRMTGRRGLTGKSVDLSYTRRQGTGDQIPVEDKKCKIYVLMFRVIKFRLGPIFKKKTTMTTVGQNLPEWILHVQNMCWFSITKEPSLPC